jgi:hypothetical protein
MWRLDALVNRKKKKERCEAEEYLAKRRERRGIKFNQLLLVR